MALSKDDLKFIFESKGRNLLASSKDLPQEVKESLQDIPRLVSIISKMNEKLMEYEKLVKAAKQVFDAFEAMRLHNEQCLWCEGTYDGCEEFGRLTEAYVKSEKRFMRMMEGI